MKQYSAISVFDLDHTLLKVSSSFSFGVFLYKNNMFPFSTMLYLVGCYWLHLLGFFSIQKLQKKIFKRIFLGCPVSFVHSLAHSFLLEKFDEMLYFPAVHKLQQAKNEGQYTVILSSSPHFLVALFAERFGVDEWYATYYAADRDQCFSDISRFVLGEEKARYVATLADKLNVPRSAITAYSDSHLDLPLLKAAGIAVGVNPNKKLQALCKEHNWQIL